MAVVKTHTYPKTISAAAKLLDKIMPYWYLKINADGLYMVNDKGCILGQLFGNYFSAMKELFGIEISQYQNEDEDDCEETEETEETEEYIGDEVFGGGASNYGWKEEVNQRKNNNTTSVLNTHKFALAADRLAQKHKDLATAESMSEELEVLDQVDKALDKTADGDKFEVTVKIGKKTFSFESDYDRIAEFVNNLFNDKKEFVDKALNFEE